MNRTDVEFEVDGGVNASNARAVCDAGADVLVAGTAIFGQPDYAEAIRAFMRDFLRPQGLDLPVTPIVADAIEAAARSAAPAVPPLAAQRG